MTGVGGGGWPRYLAKMTKNDKWGEGSQTPQKSSLSRDMIYGSPLTVYARMCICLKPKSCSLIFKEFSLVHKHHSSATAKFFTTMFESKDNMAVRCGKDTSLGRYALRCNRVEWLLINGGVVMFVVDGGVRCLFRWCVWIAPGGMLESWGTLEIQLVCGGECVRKKWTATMYNAHVCDTRVCCLCKFFLEQWCLSKTFLENSQNFVWQCSKNFFSNNIHRFESWNKHQSNLIWAMRAGNDRTELQNTISILSSIFLQFSKKYFIFFWLRNHCFRKKIVARISQIPIHVYIDILTNEKLIYDVTFNNPIHLSDDDTEHKSCLIPFTKWRRWGFLRLMRLSWCPVRKLLLRESLIEQWTLILRSNVNMTSIVTTT